MKKILIIEDDAHVRNNLAEILELSDYHAITAENGKDGVDKALKEAPDLIICDIMMPDLDGYGTLTILSKNPKTADIPFIYLTAKAEKDDFRRGMSMGADDYITKPFDDMALLNTIEARLRKYERLKLASPAQGVPILEHFINEAKANESIKTLSENRELRHFRKKDMVFDEGETPRWLYFIEKGRVKVYKTAEDGREFIVRIAEAGEFLGYLALLQEKPYTESAAVLDDADLRFIPKPEFLSLVYGNRDVMARFIKMLAGHVSEQEQQLLDLAYNSVRKRVATALVELADPATGTIKMFRDDLAAMVGTAKETFIRTMAEFKTEGLIETSDGSIRILKPERLRTMHN